MITVEEFQKFIGNNKEGFFFAKEGFLYASDTCIIIRLEPGHDIFLGDGQASHEKAIKNLYQNHLPPGKLIEEKLPCNWSTCLFCKGSGKRKTEEPCKACNGEGGFESDGAKIACPLCAGSGVTESDTETETCEECEGAGRKYDWTPIGKFFFAGKYLEMIRALPFAKMYLPKTSKGPAYFSFDGGDGFVMPRI